MDWAQEQADRIIEDIKRDLIELNKSTSGWTKVDYPHGYKSRYEAIDIELWVESNCGTFKKYGRTYYFKEEKDAALFLLKWS